MQQQVEDADIVIVATNAEKAVITKQSLLHSGPKVLVDLSIPNNIEASVNSLEHITLANVDDLSKINDKTLLNTPGRSTQSIKHYSGTYT
jgi:glutamyl-tRNA reductase